MIWISPTPRPRKSRQRLLKIKICRTVRVDYGNVFPHPDETDPNPALSFWYLFIFGMMMGDAGYGFIISLATFLFLKIKSPKIKALAF